MAIQLCHSANHHLDRLLPGVRFMDCAGYPSLEAPHQEDWPRFKITLLYALNSLSLLFAYGMILALALIVVTPIEDTREHSIDIIWNEANRYFADHLQFAVIALLCYVVLDLAYMKYLVRRCVTRHTLILFVANAVVLFSAVYLSVGSYYTGMLQEIDRYFLGR